MKALIFAVLLILPTGTQPWQTVWLSHVANSNGLTQEQVSNWKQLQPEPEPEPEPEPAVRRRRVTAGVEQWRPLVEQYFRPENVQWALNVMQCESGGDPNAKNPHSSASGLFQHLARYWPERSAKAGWAGADIFDPEANIAVAAWLFNHGGPSHWTCKG